MKQYEITTPLLFNMLRSFQFDIPSSVSEQPMQFLTQSKSCDLLVELTFDVILFYLLIFSVALKLLRHWLLNFLQHTLVLHCDEKLF